MPDASLPTDFNAAMRDKIAALGSVPLVSAPNLTQQTATNILWRQLLLLLSGGPSTQFVFRPGAVGPQPSGIYTDWATLHAAAILAPGPITIYLDNTFVTPAPIVIPAGNWDFPRQDVTLSGALGFSNVDVQLDDNVTLNGVVSITGFLQIKSLNNTTPVITAPPPQNPGAPFAIVLDRGVNLHVSGTAPFIEIPADGFMALAMLQGGGVDAGVINVVDGVLGFTVLICFCVDSATVIFDSISSTGANTVLFFIFSAASKYVDFTGQPNFLGTVLTDLIDSAGNIGYFENNVANWSGIPPGTVANALDRIAAAIGPIA